MSQIFQTMIPVEKFEIFAEGLDHPEGLAFEAEGLLWAGGEAGQVYRMSSKGRLEEVANIGGFCLGLTFSPDDVLYICNHKLHSIVRVEKSGRSSLFADWAGKHKLQTPNAGVFDSDGNFYVSDSGEHFRRNGCVIRFDKNGKGEVFATSFAFSNGMAMSADERAIFVVESNTDSVIRVEIRPDGKAGARDVYASGLERVPDGVAFDEQGNLYVSCYASDNIYRVTPRREVQLIAYDRNGFMLTRPTNVAFGGLKRDELYVANLGMHHICRTTLGTPGQPLANQQSHVR
jgi:gluconolactonase